MSRRSPKSERKSLFYHDLASPISSRRVRKLNSGGQADGISGFSYNSDVPPPPSFTLEDRSDFSDPKMSNNNNNKVIQSQVASSSWWTLPGRSELVEGMGKGSPVDGNSREVSRPEIESNSSTTQRMLEMKTENTHVKVKDEVTRPEIERNSSPVGNLNEQEWVTVYGFSPGHINIVLREFEKCGFILKHIPGPRNTNWMHILYQSRSDAQKALNKNGMQIDRVQIVGVKRVGPAQQLTLNERLNNPTQVQRMQEMKTDRVNRHAPVMNLPTGPGNFLWVVLNNVCLFGYLFTGVDMVSGWVFDKYEIEYRVLEAMCGPIIAFNAIFVVLLHEKYRGMPHRLVGCRGRAIIELVILVCAIILRVNFPYDGSDFRKIGLLILVTSLLHSWAQILHLSYDICIEDLVLHALMQVGIFMSGNSTFIVLMFIFGGLIWVRYKYYLLPITPEAVKKDLNEQI